MCDFLGLSFAKTLRGHKSRPVTMSQAHPHAIDFKRILCFGEGQGQRGICEVAVARADSCVSLAAVNAFGRDFDFADSTKRE
jgi:hypothetical protein